MNTKGDSQMVWSAEYETGNDLVDKDHKQIFELVKNVLDGAYLNRKEKVDMAIGFLAEYTLRHFANEERLMKESSYPGMDEHKRQHSDFAESVILLQKKVKDEGDSMDLSIEINRAVVDWLVKHVLGSDKRFTTHYKNWLKKK